MRNEGEFKIAESMSVRMGPIVLGAEMKSGWAMKSATKAPSQGLRRPFAIPVSVILAVAAVAKIMAILQARPHLQLPSDLIPHITIRDSLMAALTLEAIGAIFIFVNRPVFIKVGRTPG